MMLGFNGLEIFASTVFNNQQNILLILVFTADNREFAGNSNYFSIA